MKAKDHAIGGLLTAVFCAFCFGVGTQQVGAYVTNCTSAKCEPEYAWTVAPSSPGSCTSAQDAMTGVNIENAICGI